MIRKLQYLTRKWSEFSFSFRNWPFYLRVCDF